MRSLFLLLLLVAPLGAQDDPASVFQAFEKARAEFEKEGARSAMLDALQTLEALDDPRAFDAIVAALAHSVGLERRLLEAGQEEQRKGVEAQERMIGLRGEIDILEQRKESGATGVDEQIRARREESDKLEEIHRLAEREWVRLQRRSDDVAAVREALTSSCARLLAKGGDTDAGRAGVAKLRESLDASQPDQALVLVRVLRASGQRAGEPCLIELLGDGKNVDIGVARAAISALATLRTRTGALALIALWEREPDRLGTAVRHSLSMAARSNLADLDQAKAWAESLEN